MWSGPRNISTAMMRSWENRGDTIVVDEPLYAYYLQTTGIDHPSAREIIAAGETDWRTVVRSLCGPLAETGSVFFQKQMTLHLLPEVDRSFLASMKNCFLIRDPRDVIASYHARRPNPELADLGFLQQAELYRWVRDNTDQEPPVLDARDVANHPREVLTQLCERLDLGFDESMLRWPAGRRDSDGIWARHWYGAVEQSTGWSPYRASSEPLPARLESMYEKGLEVYIELFERRIQP